MKAPKVHRPEEVLKLLKDTLCEKGLFICVTEDCHYCMFNASDEEFKAWLIEFLGEL